MADAGDVTTEVAESDAALVGAARAGCPDAFAALYEGHRARVAGVVRRRVRADDVDDVVQDTFTRAWQRLSTLEDGHRFGPWVRTIAVRTAADHLRAGGVRDVPVDGPELVDVTDDVVERLDRRRRADHVVAQLGALSPRDGRALWLRDALGTPVPDLADELGLTEASTRVLLSRARRRLRGIVGAVAAWLAGLLLVRRSTTASPVPVAAVLGAAVVVGVSTLPHTDPGPPPTPRAAHDAATTAPAAADRAPAPGPAPQTGRAESDVGTTPTRHAAVDAVAAGAATPAPSPDRVLPDPRLERRPLADEDERRDLTVRGPNGEAVVSVHDGGELEGSAVELPAPAPAVGSVTDVAPSLP